MAWPLATLTPGDAARSVDTTARGIKSFAQSANTVMAAQSVSGNHLLQIMSEMKSAIETWNAAAAVPGIVAYVRDEKNDQALDVVAELTAMVAAAAAVRDRVIAGFPASGGYILKDQLGADGSISVRQFTPAQTAVLRGDLDALIVAIG